MVPAIYARLKSEIEKVYVGVNPTIQALLVAMITGGHVLLEGVPGLAKTTLAKGLAKATDAEFKRIQFTSDLLPADITGSCIYRMDHGKFKFIPGPIFTNILLVDEINRASARTQSALLEAMQENQVTVDGRTYKLPKPFFVIATQNPQEERGTYPLPDSQLDRFMFRIRLDYPTAKQEKSIIMQAAIPEVPIHTVFSPDDMDEIHKTIAKIQVSDAIGQYITDLIRQTREMPVIERGASPRAGVMLLNAAKGYAFLRKAEFVIPDDVQKAAPLILNHRLILTQDAPPVNEVIRELLEKVKFT